MKSKLAGVGASKAVIGASLALLLCGLGTSARADAIPYPTPGVVNPVVYTFTAAATGNITAYFAGSSADNTSDLGMLVKGVSTGLFGLQNNPDPALGTSFVLGFVTAGDVLTFQLRTLNPAQGSAFSDPTLNGPFDGGNGIQHVYSTAYTATSPIIGPPGVIPAGTYVGFEDLPGGGDRDYNDLQFVFTNVAVNVPGPIVGAGLPGLILACGALLALARRRRQLVA
jgi:hypothetical protein